MAIQLNKTLYRTVLIVTFLAINTLIIYGIGAAWTFMNTGADKTSMLHLEVPMEDVYKPNLNWTNLDNPGRPMEKQALGEITNDYMNAWHVRNIAYKKNDRYGIEDFYTDSARVRLYDIIDLNLKNNHWYKRTTLNHNPALDFYTADGTMVVFKDHNVEEYQEAYEGESLLFKEKDTTSYQVMMLLEDGFWRIRHLKEIAAPIDTSKIKKRNIEAQLKKINTQKGLNYYPKDSPWDTFGKRFNDTIIEKDFKIIHDMGLNTIRVFIQYEDFGKNRVDAKKLDLLKKLLDKAEDNNLDVLITLFDFYGDYDISNWTLTHRHAEAIVNAVKDHPALVGWDIKNEPDLDFESRGKENVLQWLKQMILEIKNWDTKNPITIGWSSPEAALNLSEEVDFISFHYYKQPEYFIESFKILRYLTPNKPIVLQEYGESSYDGMWSLFSGSNEKQAAYYKEMQGYLAQENIPYLFWTLYDFKKVPSSVAGSLPWRTKKQHFFGVLDSVGNKKPSYHELVIKK
ncbi:cellulase family glycosylhydrolase [Maribacter sp. M208]|uniref:glycoside hydrolase family 2 TIM barrel-domain containing protein n=1 Tax=Maribacter TaxID=252356 RepID=UPI0023EDA1EE|nr:MULTISPECIES: glycoside hydrolase family 2 TIM barrel-domain containing protein [Maribacter]MDF4221835.1 cellulase family glycosylhydrolase [Maribacter huludaoensis]